MKKFPVWLLLIATILNLCGCAASSARPENAQAQTTVESTAAEAETAIVETAAVETEPPVVEANLFLKVSSITFSVVGESEDIYLGMVPRELVSWESEDPSVVSVENGVLTANGTGTTTIRATYGDRQVQCSAGCLAETQEELDSLDFEIVSAPKRLPPEVNLEEPCTYFDNAALVGDSISYILFQFESKSNYLGDMLFLARGGVSMNGFVRRYKNIVYQGEGMYLEDAIAKSQVERVYFLLGSNDIGETSQRSYFFDNWDIMRDRIREKSPDVQIVIISNLPQYDDRGRYKSSDPAIETYNALMVEYNEKLRQYAAENGFLYLDLSYYVEDHYGRMPVMYSQDSFHMNEAGCVNWMKILRFYAQYELEGGTLS